MNLKSEQLRPDLSLEINYDEVLSKKEMTNTLINCLGEDKCSFINYNRNKVLVYENQNGKKIILLYASISYLGGNGQHPIFKKRMQLPTWYKDFCIKYCHSEYEIKFVGLYHYQGMVIFTEFVKDTYLKRKMNNSAAHVYINDLYQGIKNGVFSKIDNNGNTIKTIAYSYFKNFLDEVENLENNLFELFRKLNYGFSFGQWIKAVDAIQEMHNKHWSQWRQAEWAGWFLEYKFNSYVLENSLESKMRYVGSSNKSKKEDLLDFDIWFEEQQFYGDLKASDIKKKETPGNSQESFIECINRYDKFWYIIYEHETIKDEDSNTNYEATRFRNNYIKEVDNINDDEFDELSYYRRMKHSVCFKKMSIIELNRINFREMLTVFNQGKQPDGNARKPKFIINKSNVDNFVVFRYEI